MARHFLHDESAQDLVEYTLLLAFVVVVTATLLLYNGASVAVIWGVTTDNLSHANEVIH